MADPKRIPKAFLATHRAAGKSRKMAILAFCGECMGWSTNPRDCTAPNCPLYHWRGWKRTGTERPHLKALNDERKVHKTEEGTTNGESQG